MVVLKPIEVGDELGVQITAEVWAPMGEDEGDRLTVIKTADGPSKGFVLQAAQGGVR